MTVFLVGAGPGDPGLLTVRGAEVLAAAEVVVHDRLVDAAVLALAPAAAERIDVGKAPGGPIEQEQINALLVQHGASGRRVVRLKGGDPFVLGRGGEEAIALAAAGVDFEVVPGISSAVAVPAYAGIPVTHRGVAGSFTVVTGHSRHSAEIEPDWGALARSRGTLVLLMGVAHRAEVAAKLIAGGLDATTPVAAVTRGTLPEQRTVRTTLGALGDAEVAPTSVIVIGAVAALDLAWFERRPLFGRTVVVTRARADTAALTRALQDQGAAVVELPVIEIAGPRDGGAALREVAGRLGGFDWVAFTSANAVRALLAELRDARGFGAARVAAVGRATAAALAERGITADLVPEPAHAEALVAALGAPSDGGRVLVPQAAAARPTLVEGLRTAGWRVEVVEAYVTQAASPPQAQLTEARAADAVTFLSPSAVAAFVALVGAAEVPPVVACIGEVTADAAREAGLEVAVVSHDTTAEDLAAALAVAAPRLWPRPEGHGDRALG